MDKVNNVLSYLERVKDLKKRQSAVLLAQSIKESWLNVLEEEFREAGISEDIIKETFK